MSNRLKSRIIRDQSDPWKIFALRVYQVDEPLNQKPSLVAGRSRRWVWHHQHSRRAIINSELVECASSGIHPFNPSEYPDFLQEIAKNNRLI